MGSRQSKFTTRRDPARTVLQSRDVELLKSVFDLRCLRRDQVQQLLKWSCTTSLNARLRKLFDAGYIERTFLPTLRGSSQAVYSPGRRVGEVLSPLLNLSPKEIRKQIRMARALSPLFLGHSLLVSEARIKLSEAFQRSGIRVDLWLNDLACVDHFTYNNPSGRTVNRHFKPDSYVRFIHAGKLFSVFLEIDTGSMAHRRILQKVKIYREYKDLGLYTQRFGFKNLRILFVVCSNERASELKSCLEADKHMNIWFINLTELTPDAIFRNVWRKTFEAKHTSFLPLETKEATVEVLSPLQKV